MLKIVNGIPTRVEELPYDAGFLTYDVQHKEQFEDLSAIDTAKTKATRSGVTMILSYDNENITVVGTAVTIASTPNFTVQVGDIIRQGTTIREITGITTQTQVTVDSAGLSTGAATISQAVHTVDINRYGSAGDKTRPIDFNAANISTMLLQYFDNTPEATGTDAYVAFVASSNGFTNQTNVTIKPQLSTSTVSSVTFGTAGDNLKIKFFSNITVGQGTVRLSGFKCAF
jgi:hypothetical protein